MKYKSLLTTFLILFTTIISSHTYAAKKMTLKLAHNLDPEHVVSQAIDHMAKEVLKESNGSIRIRIYGSGQMGGPRETIEMMQNHALDMTKGNASEMEPFIKELSVYNLPYLFDNKKHFDKVVYGPIGQELMKKTEDQGFIAIAAYIAGYRSFYTKKPIYTPTDMKGLKIRVISTPTTNKMVELLGASPVPIPFGEVYTAIQQGVIDGAENNEPSYYQTRHHEIAPYFSEDQHTSIPDYLLISTKVWAKLDDNQRAIITKAAQNAERYQKELWEKEVANSRAQAEKQGATFIQVDKTPFRKALEPLYDDFMKDPTLAAWINKIKAAAN